MTWTPAEIRSSSRGAGLWKSKVGQIFIHFHFFSDPFWLIIDFDIEPSILGSLPIPSLLTDLYFSHLHVNGQILQEGLNHPQSPRMKLLSQWIGVLKPLTLKCLQTVSPEGCLLKSLRADLLVGKTLSWVLLTSELGIQLHPWAAWPRDLDNTLRMQKDWRHLGPGNSVEAIQTLLCERKMPL